MHGTPLQARKPVSGMEEPGAFQCTLLRAFELPKAYREVFLLKEIQGHTLEEIAAILGIRIDTAGMRSRSRGVLDLGCGAWAVPTPWSTCDEDSGEFANANLVREQPGPPSNRAGDTRSSTVFDPQETRGLGTGEVPRTP